MKLRLSISRAIVVFGILTTLGLGAVIATSLYAVTELKVGGPLYSQIKLGNDLVADILPPPEYVIEAYLEATLAMQDGAPLASHRARLVQLKKDYDDRHAFWSASELTPEIKTKLVERSHREVTRFWSSVFDVLLPALESGDQAAAVTSYARTSTAYSAHRAVIDDIVKQTNDANAETERAAFERVNVFNSVMWTVSIVVLLIIGGGLLGVGFGVIRPMRDMTSVMKRLADGDLETSIPALGRGDEVGAMARAVHVFKEHMIQVEELRSEQIASKERAEAERKAVVQRLAGDFELAIGEIVDTVSASSSQLESSANGLAATAGRTQQLTVSVGAASEQASANVQSVASAAEQMSSSVGEISRQVHEASQIAGEAVGQIEETNARVGELSAAAAKISDVVALIHTIAGQTNLLALNATIEAARAGEAGRGFAVVASEVKALAEQTAKATGEISQQIASIQSATTHSVDAISAITGTINRMSEIASTIASAIEEQGAATQEISRNVQQAAQGTMQVSSNITDVQRGASDTGSASAQVLSSAQLLAKDSTRLKTEVGKFLHSVRVA
uniref:Methyl-accepting chemotaxis sensory transducer n=1 Tax=Rhodopseudomonas palustris (strain BisA53) TaxID=316055 RepID=Q07K13_RHOP5